MKKRIIVLVLALVMCLGIAVPAMALGQTVEMEWIPLSITNVISVTKGVVENDYYWFEEIPGVEIFGYDKWVNEWHNPPDTWYYFIGLTVDGQHDISNRIDNEFIVDTYTVSGSTTIALTHSLTWADHVPPYFWYRVDVADDSFSNNIITEFEDDEIPAEGDEDVMLPVLAYGSQIQINGPGVYLLRMGLPGDFDPAYLIIVEDDSDTSARPPATPLDGASNWATPELQLALDAGLLIEDMYGSWPQETSRLLAADAIVRLIEVSTGKDIDMIAAEKDFDMNDRFADTDSKAATFLKASGISNGVDGGNYGYAGTFTRAQLVTMLGRMAENVFDMDLSGYPLGSDTFTDIPAYMDWAEQYIGWAVAVGITQGDGSATTFNPEGNLSNQQTGLFAYRAFDKVFG